MSEKRRDNRGRILHTGEVQLSTGQYRYRKEAYRISQRNGKENRGRSV